MERIKQISSLPICCDSCKARNKSGDEFTKLINLNNSGLSVYINTSSVGKTDTNKKESVIFHNDGNKVVKKHDFISELSCRKTKCFLCNTLIQKVCNLINEVTEIKENETIAICEHCKRSSAPNKCKRCDDVLKKFLNNQINQYKYHQQALKIRLYEVRRILSLIVDKKNICDHKICQAYYDSNAELKILLELIKSPLPSKIPDIEEYFSIMKPLKDSESKYIGSDLFLKYSGDLYHSKESLVASTSDSRSESFCISKYLRNSKESISPIKSQEKSTTVLKGLNEKDSVEITSAFSKKSKKKEETKSLTKKSGGKEKVDTTKSFTKKSGGKEKVDTEEYIPVKEQRVKTEGKKKNSKQNDVRNRNIDSKELTSLTPPTLKPISKVISPIKSKKKSTTTVLKDLNEKASVDKTSALSKKPKKKEETKPITKKSGGKKKVDNEENIPVEEQRAKTEGKKRNSKQNEDYKMLMKLIQDKKKEKKETEKSAKKEKKPVMPKIEDFPQIKRVEKQVETESLLSESIIECGQKAPFRPPESILGNRIVPFQRLQKLHPNINEPLIYEVQHEFISPEKTLPETATTASGKSTTTTTLKSKSYASGDTTLPGIIKYELSNKIFIEKGWTQLPYTKIVRRMNIYKMVPAYPQFDWFDNHKMQILYYNTGEKLAEVDTNGCGRWFYKNGLVALEYYKTKDINAALKYVVYDNDDVVGGKKNKSRKILASFDHQGNGIVYDNIGNARLKYNQSEGLVIDKKLGPPGKWKWHTLNDPPVLQHVYVDSVEESDKCFGDVIKQYIQDPDMIKRADSERMLAIEFENFVKERASKMLQTYKQFEIRMKAVKINECFSVRIRDQANIYLLFRCNQVSLKVNMGLLLISNEIVDSIVSDVADVATPFDRPISRPKSVSSI